MILRSSSVLGLAFSDRSIACAELSASGGRRSVRHLATFALPGELTGENAAATGQALATFLRQEHFGASRAVVGLPAKWLVAMDREVPPADEQQMRDMLRLQAERLAVGESGEVVFDFTGSIDSSRGGKVLLVGVMQQRLNQIEQMLDAAGVSVVAAMPTSVALMSGVDGAEDQPMLLLSRGGTEMVWQQHGSARVLRHVVAVGGGQDAAVAVGPLGSELRRTVTLTPTNGSGPARELLLWDGVGLSDEQVSELSGRLGISVRSERGLERLGIQPGAPAAGGSEPHGAFAPAVALALAGAREQVLPLDFKHSKLTPPVHRRISRTAAWSIVLGVVLVAAVTALYVNVSQRQAELDGLNESLTSLEDGQKAAKELLAKVTYARGFFDHRPPLLDCMKEITLSLRDEDRLWITSFSFRESGKGQITGKAADLRSIDSLRDRLIKNPKFGGVRTLQVTEVNTAGGRGAKEQSFTISFIYIEME